MKGPYEERLPEDLQGIASRLRQERAEIDDLKLDQLKQTVLARFSASNGKRALFRSRLAAVGATLAVLGGGGGALAVSGAVDNHPNTRGGAASDQYSSPKQPSSPTNHGKLRKQAACAPRRHGKSRPKTHGKHYAKGHSKSHRSCSRRRAPRKHHHQHHH